MIGQGVEQELARRTHRHGERACARSATVRLRARHPGDANPRQLIGRQGLERPAEILHASGSENQRVERAIQQISPRIRNLEGLAQEIR